MISRNGGQSLCHGVCQKYRGRQNSLPGPALQTQDQVSIRKSVPEIHLSPGRLWSYPQSQIQITFDCMKMYLTRLAMLMVACLVIGGLVSCAEKSELDKPAETTLMVTVEKFNEAYLKCDDVTLDQLLTISYQHTNGGTAPMNRQDWLKFVRLRGGEIAKKDLVIEKYALSGTAVDYYEHVAVLTGTIESVEIQRGNREVATYRTTQVWVREGSKWKRAAYQDARVR